MINVIIADDDYNARAGLLDMIAWDELGANVIATVEDGEQVVKLLGQCPNVDLIILDICMPYMDGLTVAKYIRENDYETEIVLLSAHAEFDYAREALKYGIREYIIKPINRSKLNQLTEIVKTVCKEKKESVEWKMHLHGAELREDVKTALRYKDADAVQRILNVEQSFNSLSAKRFNEYCSVVFGYMREYFKGSNKDVEMLEKRINIFYEISDVKAMKSSLEEIIEFLFVSDDKSSGRNSVNIVKAAKQYIDANILSSDICSSNVATHFNLSVDHLSRLFRSAGEDSLSDYIIKSKIDKAKYFISDTTYSIRQVAQILGYTDPNYFVKIFKKKTGVTPTEFRIGAKERME